MFSRRIIGVFLAVGLACTHWSDAQAQEFAAPEETAPEIQLDEPVEQPEQPHPAPDAEQEPSPETTPLLPPVEGAENNDPHRLESIGLEIKPGTNP